DMKPIRQTRNEVVELVRRRGETVQQDDGRLRRVPGLAVEELEARNVGGLEVHKAFSSVGVKEQLRVVQRFAVTLVDADGCHHPCPLARLCSKAPRSPGTWRTAPPVGQARGSSARAFRPFPRGYRGR